MNHAYRLVRNTEGQTVPAAEHTRAHGKSGGPALRLVGAAVLATLAASSHALPTGNQTVAGQGNVASSGGNMTVTQQSSNLSINWQGFSIGANESVRFVQPSSSAIALNRVVGGDPSSIYGNLSANGQVFLINPNGVLFGPGARVDVGGLVASTLDISDADFAARRFKFSSSSAHPAAVTNQGTLTAGTGGYIALLGGQVSNQGTISARLGTAALAAGSAMTLDFSGDKLLNVKIDADALGALASNGQLINADGGTVIMTAGARDALLSTVVNNSGVIEARTVENRAGVITLLGTDANGHLAGTVKVAGTLDVSAPAALNPGGGDAGFVDTSGANVEIVAGTQVRAGAAQGRAGTWLIDPTDIIINAAAAGTIAGTLNGGGNVTQSTSSGGTDAGNITVAAPITWSGTGTLSLIADHDIAINAAISGANGGLSLSAANNISAPAAVNVGTFTLTSGNWSQLGGSLPAFSATDFRITGGSFLRALGGDGSAGNPYLLTDTYGLQGMGSSTLLGSSFALANDISAAGTANWNSGDGFAPVGDSSTAYTGSFNGNSHTISNLTIARPTQDYVGLFGYIGAGGAASNLTLAGGTANGASQVGMLAGQSDGSVTNVSSSGNVVSGGGGVSGSNIGGLIGYNTGAVSNASASGTVTDGMTVGGLVGSNDGTLSNISATGAVSGFFTTGGLVGSNSGSVSNASASGTVAGSFDTGGLIGSNQGSVSNAHATGAVSGSSSTGGLTGSNSGTLTDVYATGAVSADSSSAGGLVGTNDGTITRAYATGDVTGYQDTGGLIGTNNSGGTVSVAWAGGVVSGSNWYAGGMVGSNHGGSFTDSYASGRVRALDYAGGFFGFTDGSGTFTRNYASGSVATTGGPTAPHVGGFGGQSSGGTFTNNFWDRTSTGQSRASPIGSQASGLTTAQAMTQSSYTNFNFTSTWVIYAGQTRPMLRAFLTPLMVTAANTSKTYDGTSYSGGAGISLPSGADSSKVLGTPVYGGTSQGARNAGAYGITLSGLYSTQTGYLISYAPGTLTINQKSISVAASASDKVYDGTTGASVTLSSTGLIAGDVINFASTGADFDTRNAGTGKTVTVSGLSASGAASGNYVLAGTSTSTTASITAATLTYVATNATRTGGQTPSGLTGSLTGLVGGDTLASATTGSTAWTTPATAASAAGTYAILGGGLTANHGNYVFQQSLGNNTALTLTPAPPAPSGGGGSGSGSGSGSGTGNGSGNGSGSTPTSGQVLADLNATQSASLIGGEAGAQISASNTFSAPPPPCMTGESASGREDGSARERDVARDSASCTQLRHAPGTSLRLLNLGIRLPAGFSAED